MIQLLQNCRKRIKNYLIELKH